MRYLLKVMYHEITGSSSHYSSVVHLLQRPILLLHDLNQTASVAPIAKFRESVLDTLGHGCVVEVPLRGLFRQVIDAAFYDILLRQFLGFVSFVDLATFKSFTDLAVESYCAAFAGLDVRNFFNILNPLNTLIMDLICLTAEHSGSGHG